MFTSDSLHRIFEPITAGAFLLWLVVGVYPQAALAASADPSYGAAPLTGNPHADRKEASRPVVSPQTFGLDTAIASPAGAALSADRVEELGITLDDTVARLRETRAKLAASPNQQGMIDLLIQLLDLSRARLRGGSAEPSSDQELQTSMLAILHSAQARLDEARARAKGSPDARELLSKIDDAQARLDRSRLQILGGASALGAQPVTQQQLEEILQRAQRDLDQARDAAEQSPAAEEQLRRVELAQEQLDRAQANARALPAAGTQPQ